MTVSLHTVYGPGGFDPSKPNNNILSEEEYEADPVGEAPLSVEDRLAVLEAEVRGMKERATQAQVTGDAKKVRDAVVGA